jgi:hypothetical protein
MTFEILLVAMLTWAHYAKTINVVTCLYERRFREGILMDIPQCMDADKED